MLNGASRVLTRQQLKSLTSQLTTIETHSTQSGNNKEISTPQLCSVQGKSPTHMLRAMGAVQSQSGLGNLPFKLKYLSK